MQDSHDSLAAARGQATKSSNGHGSLSDRVRSLRLNTGNSPSKPRSAWLPWGLTVIAFLTAAVFGWRAYRLSPSEPGPQSEQASAGISGKLPASPSTSSLPPSATGDVVLDAKGYVIAAHQIQLSPQVGGEIIWLDPQFKEGAVYRKGEVLARVDPVIYAARLKSSQAALRVAEVNLREVQSGSALQEIQAARAQLKNMAAKLEQARIDERTKRLAGIAVARAEMENSVQQVAVDSAAREAQNETLRKLEVSLEERRLVCQAQVLKCQADVEEAEKQLKNCTMLAPTTGIVLTKKAELGGYVNPLAFGAAGYLCEMADLRDLEVELDIQERDIKWVRPGQHCRIMPEAGQRDDEFLQDHPQGYSGVVSRRMPMANRTKGAITVRVKIEIPEKERSGEYLLPDMGALVSFLKQEK
jgi:multidrug resistance efflux pump